MSWEAGRLQEFPAGKRKRLQVFLIQESKLQPGLSQAPPEVTQQVSNSSKTRTPHL